MQEIGHDGKEVIWPNLSEPYCFRSYHLQEFTYCCLRRGFTLTELQPILGLCPGFNESMYELPDQTETILQWMEGNPALILTGRHACAWDGYRVFDPKGYINDVNDYCLRAVHLCVKEISNPK